MGAALANVQQGLRWHIAAGSACSTDFTCSSCKDAGSGYEARLLVCTEELSQEVRFLNNISRSEMQRSPVLTLLCFQENRMARARADFCFHYYANRKKNLNCPCLVVRA